MWPYGPPSSGIPSTLYVDLFNAQTVAGAKTFTGTLTVNKTAQTSGAETIAVFGVTDTVGYIAIKNGTVGDTLFTPFIESLGTTTTEGLFIRARITSDAGTRAGSLLDVRTSINGPLVTRPLYELSNSGTTVLQVIPLNSGANSALSWGTQGGAVPSFTTRSAGTRIILRESLSPSLVDYAIGFAPGATATIWQSAAAATTFHDFRWYGGTTELARLRGDGQLTLTAQANLASYTVATLPSAATAGGLVYVSNAAVAPCMAFSNGTNWKRCDNAATTVV